MPTPPWPPMTPPKVRTPLPQALVVMVRLAAPSAMAPVFWVRLAFPLKSTLPPKTIGLAMVAATLASRAPPLRFRLPGVAPEPPKAKVADPAMSVPPVPAVVSPE